MKQKIIESFSGENIFLSNFYPCMIEYDGLLYPSVEHAYQAQKTQDLDKKRKFTHNPPTTISAAQAKKLGRQLVIRPKWDRIKDDVMLRLIEYKFTKNEELKQKLLDTFPKYLEEGNTWHDNYWGACKCLNCKDKTHHNSLGHILMIVRDKIRGVVNLGII